MEMGVKYLRNVRHNTKGWRVGYASKGEKGSPKCQKKKSVTLFLWTTPTYPILAPNIFYFKQGKEVPKSKNINDSNLLL